jgi:tRNA (guanine37-N1)-methyltransferase
MVLKPLPLQKNHFMRIDLLTIFPELFESPFNHSMLKRAKEKGIVEIFIHNIRDYSTDKHKSVDDYSFGGSAGMVMMIQPIESLILTLKDERSYDEIIYMTPDAPVFNQKEANKMSLLDNIIILCGHYKGVDQRIRDHYITKEISVGDYVLTGGELAAAIVVDSVVRLIPGVLSDETSALTDSFQDGLLSPPVYTRPANYNGWEVPDILLSGNNKLIDEWREKMSFEITQKIRPDLLQE